jgi:hypothetical protein
MYGKRLHETEIMNALSEIDLAGPKELAAKIGANPKYLTRRLAILVADGKIVRCVDFRKDARTIAYRKKPKAATETVDGVSI